MFSKFKSIKNIVTNNVNDARKLNFKPINHKTLKCWYKDDIIKLKEIWVHLQIIFLFKNITTK